MEKIFGALMTAVFWVFFLLYLIAYGTCFVVRSESGMDLADDVLGYIGEKVLGIPSFEPLLPGCN